MKKDISRYKKFNTAKCWGKNTSEKPLPGERWKPIPFFEDTHEVSNYGRLRSLSPMIFPKNNTPYWRKGRIMSAGVQMIPNHFTRDFSYHVSINIESEGKEMGFSVKRLVYHCFVKPIDIPYKNDPADLIIAKDGNGMNTY